MPEMRNFIHDKLPHTEIQSAKGKKMSDALKDKTIVVIGGSTGIGFSVAQTAIAKGANVIIGARDAQKLQAAAAKLGERAKALEVDTSDHELLAAFFKTASKFDHLFISAATYTIAGIDSNDEQAIESPFRSKFWGQYWAVKQALPYLDKAGSITLMAGAAGARPIKGGAIYAACNSAIEGLGRGLAIDLAPIRVNTISPGTIDGHLWQNRPQEIREMAFEHYRGASLVGRPGTEQEIADTVLYLMENRFVTGSTLYPDGGYALR
jgi:NAD(P)-dependent dehydrogenase (short-subunit alcohol dehydrogenase family)